MQANWKVEDTFWATCKLAYEYLDIPRYKASRKVGDALGQDCSAVLEDVVSDRLQLGEMSCRNILGRSVQKRDRHTQTVRNHLKTHI